MEGFILSHLSLLQRNALYFQTRRKILTKSTEREILVKGTRSWCVVVKCIKDNNYARYHTPRYHCCREMNFISRLEIKF